jgi:hypothetical protein
LVQEPAFIPGETLAGHQTGTDPGVRCGPVRSPRRIMG